MYINVIGEEKDSKQKETKRKCLPFTFICIWRHRLSLQYAHQLRRALSMTQFPFPASKERTKTKRLFVSLEIFLNSTEMKKRI